MNYQPVDTEFSGFFHYRVRLFSEIFLISAKLIMVPDILTTPGNSHRPHTITDRTGWFREMPWICCIMSYDSLHSVNFSGSTSRVRAKSINEIDERFLQLTEISNLRGPVIHLYVK